MPSTEPLTHENQATTSADTAETTSAKHRTRKAKDPPSAKPAVKSAAERTAKRATDTKTEIVLKKLRSAIKRRGQEARIVIGSAPAQQRSPDQTLIDTVCRANALLAALTSGDDITIGDVADRSACIVPMSAAYCRWRSSRPRSLKPFEAEPSPSSCRPEC